MKLIPSSNHIQIVFLAFILLLLPVYGYACVLPMMDASGDAHTNACNLIHCGLNGSQENAQKYCEPLKKAELQSFHTLQNALPKITFGPSLVEYLILPEVIRVHLTFNTLEEANFLASQNLYLLHRTLLL